MKKLLIHVHVYYPERWEELKASVQYLENYDLKVTVAEHLQDFHSQIKQDFPAAQIFTVPNRGYDIAPFLYVLKQANLDDYEFILKLHTKRLLPEGEYLNRYLVSGDKWKNYLLEPFQSLEQMNKNYALFSHDKTLGAVSHYKCIIPFRRDKLSAKFYEYRSDSIIKDSFFIAGTMFLARACLLKEFQELKYDFEDFEEPKKDSFQLAHYLERFLGYSVYKQGYAIKPYDYNQKILCLKRKIFWNIAKFINYYEK